MNFIKPYFVDDIAKHIASIYFSSNPQENPSPDKALIQTGFAMALSALAIAIGLKPESFLLAGDVKRVQDYTGRRL